MNINELRQQKAEKVERMQTIIDGAQTEKRNCNKQEVAEWQSLENEVRALDFEIEALETQEKRNKELVINNLDKQEDKNRMTKKLQNIVAENRSGDMLNNFTIDTRSIDLTSGIYNETVFGEIYTNGEVPLYPTMGVKYMSGLVGNLKLPKFSGVLLGGKVAPGTESMNDKTLGSVDLIDNDTFRLSETVSKEMLKQDSLIASVIAELVKGVDRKIYQQIFTVALAAATEVSGVTSVSYANMNTLESTIEPANQEGYLMSKTAFFGAKNTIVDAGSGRFLISKSGANKGVTIDGTPVYFSSAIAKQYIYGDLSSIVVGEWDGIDVTIDIYSKAKDGQAVITVAKKAAVVNRGVNCLVKSKIA